LKIHVIQNKYILFWRLFIMSFRWLCLTTCLTVFLTTCGLWLEQALQAPRQAQAAAVAADPQTTGSTVIQASFQVVVTGGVRQPGKYQLIQGSLVADLVKKAGGLTDSAQIEPEALLRAVKPGEILHIAMASKANSHSAQAPQAGGNKVNLNTADQKTLMSLPGVGPVMAQRILAHRQQYGLFQSVDELLKVKGIGQKKFEKIRGQLQ